MAKIVLIDVDLGIDLNQMIIDSAKDLTRNARVELDNALAVMDSAKQLKDQKEKAKEEKSTGLDTVLMQAYEKLVAAIPIGVSVADIMSIVTMYVPNTSAFSLRMNTMLSKKGNPYRMIRVKNNNIPHYLFTPFNKVD